MSRRPVVVPIIAMLSIMLVLPLPDCSGGTPEMSADGLVYSFVPGGVSVVGTDTRDTEISVPDTVVLGGIGYDVVSVHPGAFSFSYVSEISIGANVSSIGDLQAPFLRAFSVSGSNPYYSVDCDGLLRTRDMGTVVRCPSATSLRDVVLTGDVVSVAAYAFSGTPVRSIVIPSSVTSVGEGAFSLCPALESAVIDCDVPPLMFNGCRSLSSVTLGDNVRSVGNGAFAYCTSLTSCGGGRNIVSLGERCFSFSGLTSAEIGPEVEEVGAMAFSGCGGMTGFSVDPGNDCLTIVNDMLYTADGTELVWCPGYLSGDIAVPGGTLSVGDGAFAYTRISGVAFPSGFLSVGDNAFQGSSVTSVVFPTSVGYVGGYAFNMCPSLSRIVVAGTPVFGTGALAVGCPVEVFGVDADTMAEMGCGDVPATHGSVIVYGGSAVGTVASGDAAVDFLADVPGEDLFLPDGRVLLTAGGGMEPDVDGYTSGGAWVADAGITELVDASFFEERDYVPNPVVVILALVISIVIAYVAYEYVVKRCF